MSVETITDRLAEIEGAITGITKAYSFDETPNRLDQAMMPCFVNFPGPATYEDRGELLAETRAYRATLITAPMESPIDLFRQCDLVEPLITRVRDALAARITLLSLANVEVASLVGDSGLTALFGDQYLGVQFNVEVVELTEVAYVDY